MTPACTRSLGPRGPSGTTATSSPARTGGSQLAQRLGSPARGRPAHDTQPEVPHPASHELTVARAAREHSDRARAAGARQAAREPRHHEDPRVPDGVDHGPLCRPQRLERLEALRCAGAAWPPSARTATAVSGRRQHGEQAHARALPAATSADGAAGEISESTARARTRCRRRARRAGRPARERPRAGSRAPAGDASRPSAASATRSTGEGALVELGHHGAAEHDAGQADPRHQRQQAAPTASVSRENR
jgi:hypothetical protein